MKISRLEIEDFAIENYPQIKRPDIGGDDLLVKGTNRSGKTLTLNALLYGLYGPRATFGVQPGRYTNLKIGFDSRDLIERRGGGRQYRHDGETYEKDQADEIIPTVLGPEEITSRQFIHSETDKLPLSKLSKADLLATIRRVVESDIQEEMADLEEEREELKSQLEQVERRDLRPKRRELDEINLDQLERRLSKIEVLQSLIDSGEIEDIKEQLLNNQEINGKLDKYYKRKKKIEEQLRKVNRQLRNERRYTEKVNDLILDAIDELTCPVCDHVVEESTARSRLKRGACPHCGKERDLNDLKENLEEKTDSAKENIEQLEKEKEDLEEEKGQIEEEINDLQASVPKLDNLNDLAKLTLRDHDYDIQAVASETAQRLEKQKEAIEEERGKKDKLVSEIKTIEAEYEQLTESIDDIDERVTELTEESREKIVSQFQRDWSENYREIARDFGLEIHIEEDGEVLLPGNEGPRKYGKLSTGEERLLNLAFAYTIVDTARDNDEFEDCFETIVLDEPFANLDEEKRENAMSFISEADVQVIILSSNEDLSSYFGSHQTVDLETMQIQLTFDDYDE